MEDLPKVTKAEMLPGVRLRLEFDNGQVRYYPVHEQIDLLMNMAQICFLGEWFHGLEMRSRLNLMEI